MAAGADYYQESEPSSGEEGKIWLPIDELVYDWTQATGATEKWSHSLHSSLVRSVFVRDGVVYSGSFDDTVKAAELTDENGDPLEVEPDSWQLQVSDGQEWYEV